MDQRDGRVLWRSDGQICQTIFIQFWRWIDRKAFNMLNISTKPDFNTQALSHYSALINFRGIHCEWKHFFYGLHCHRYKLCSRLNTMDEWSLDGKIMKKNIFYNCRRPNTLKWSRIRSRGVRTFQTESESWEINQLFWRLKSSRGTDFCAHGARENGVRCFEIIWNLYFRVRGLSVDVFLKARYFRFKIFISWERPSCEFVSPNQSSSQYIGNILANIMANIRVKIHLPMNHKFNFQ